MERRKFLAALVSMPLVGQRFFASSTAEASAATLVEPHSEHDTAQYVWSALDHTSSWREAVAELRACGAAGGPDPEALEWIAGLIEREAGRGAEPPGVLGLYPATVMALASLRAVRLYGTEADHRRQVELVRRLVESA